jgi:uncharacterized protein (DUF934 family)
VSAVIRNRAIVPDDWTALADDAALPASSASGPFIVSLARWQAEREALEACAAKIGLRLPNTADVLALWPQLADRPLLALEFPKFGDGRAYSQARLLRERLGFKGELRAVGEVQRDMMFYMLRTGFDAFVPRADQDLQDCLRALSDFSLAYQHGADPANITVWQRRRSRA